MTSTMDFLGAQRRARTATGGLLALFAAFVLASGVAYLVVVREIVGRVEDRLRPLDHWGEPLAWALALAFVALMAARAVRTHRRLSDSHRALSDAGARQVPLRPHDPRERQLCNVVEEVAVAASLPVPMIWVLDGQGGINALAAGADDQQAILVTDAAMRDLTRQQLQAVVAHEMAHLASGDTRINTLSAALIAGAGAGMVPFLWLGSRVLRGILSLLTTVADDSPGAETNGLLAVLILGIGAPILPMFLIAGAMSGSPVVAALWAVAVGSVPLAGIGLAGHMLGSGLAVAVSRQREHHADALAVQLTRYPEALVGAFRAVSRQPMQGHVITPERARLDHFFFARPTVDPPAFDAAVPHPDLGERARRVRSGSFVPPPAVPRQRRRTDRPRPATPGAALDALQRPLALLPDPLLVACHDASTVPLAVLAVLAAEGETPEADARRVLATAGFDADVALALTASLRPGADLLPAIEVAMPAIRQLDGPERQRLADAVRALIAADEKKTLAEHAVLQMLRWGLAETPSGRALGAEISRASDVLFAALGAAGSPLASDRIVAVEAGRQALRAAIPLPAPPEATDGDPFAGLDAALDVLRRASRVQRHAVLDAAHAVVVADGRTLRDEAALLRATALALGVACVVHPEHLAPEAEDERAREDVPLATAALG